MSCLVLSSFLFFYRIVTGNNANNKSESDQEDNDDVNDNDWSYGAEKKGNALALHLLCVSGGVQNVEWNERIYFKIFGSTMNCLSLTAKKRKSDKVHYIFNIKILLLDDLTIIMFF